MVKTIANRINEIAARHGYDLEPIEDDERVRGTSHDADNAMARSRNGEVEAAARAARRLSWGDIVGAYEALGYLMRD